MKCSGFTDMLRDSCLKCTETEATSGMKKKSFYTFMIYLNDDFEGGETEFENLLTVTPEKGTALIFTIL